MSDLYLCFFNVFCLFIWFKTEAFIEYSKYIPFLNKTFKIKEYYNYQFNGGNLSYPLFLQVNNNNFFTRLISCPYCLNFWVNLVTLPLLSNIVIFFVNYVLSIIIYSILLKLIKNDNQEL
jgi:hypothetical protein